MGQQKLRKQLPSVAGHHALYRVAPILSQGVSQQLLHVVSADASLDWSCTCLHVTQPNMHATGTSTSSVLDEGTMLHGIVAGPRG